MNTIVGFLRDGSEPTVVYAEDCIELRWTGFSRGVPESAQALTLDGRQAFDLSVYHKISIFLGKELTHAEVQKLNPLPFDHT